MTRDGKTSCLPSLALGSRRLLHCFFEGPFLDYFFAVFFVAFFTAFFGAAFFTAFLAAFFAVAISLPPIPFLRV